MNEWIQRSVDLANTTDYLDRLHDVYPVTLGSRRALSNQIKQRIKQAYDNRDAKQLVDTLLELEKFPIKDPYVAYLRKKDISLRLNPKTVERIANTLLAMSYDDIIDGCEEPKEFNRQIGTLFHSWLPKLGYPNIGGRDFAKHDGIALFNGSDSEKEEFANRVLGCNLDKGPDLLAKVGETYILGEAKFLTDTGGHQNAQFQDAMRLLKGKEGNAIRVAILDGVVWIENNNKMFNTVCQLKETALSALLLKDFLETIRKR